MKIRCNMRQLAYWILVLALAIPYLPALIPKPEEPVIPPDPLIEFSIDPSDILKWLQEADSTVVTAFGGGSRLGGGRGATRQGGTAQSEFDFTFSMKKATPDELFSHLKTQVETEIRQQGWRISEGTSTNNSASFIFSQDTSHYRIYFWNVPNGGQMRGGTNTEANSFGIKIVTIGYVQQP